MIRALEWDNLKTYLFYDRKLKQSKSNEHSLKSRFYIFSAYFSNHPFTREEFSRFIESLCQEGKSKAYCNNLLKIAKHVDRYLHNGELKVLKDATYFHESKKHYDILTGDEMKRIAEYRFTLPHYPKGLNDIYTAFYYLLIFTGCRILEALELKWEDVHSDFVIFKDTKNKEDRMVPIPDELGVRLLSLPRNTDRVFHFTYSTALHNLHVRAKKVGIQKRVFNHLIRHSFITHLLEAGVDVLTVAVLVGHKDVNATMRYNQMRMEHYRNALFMHPLLRNSLTIDGIEKRVHEYISSLLKGTKYTYLLRKSATGLAISVK